jgi:predicted O-methyltransferase YrrM
MLQSEARDGRFADLLVTPRVDAWIEEMLSDGSSPWPISAEVGRFLSHLVFRFKPRRILEFGAGSSSCVFARALSLAGGGSLTSVEQMPQWCSDRWDEVKRTGGVDAQLVVSRPQLTVGKTGLHYIYKSAAPAIAARGPYDLVFIDAPQEYYGRDGSLHLAREHLEPGALIVLDDAGRQAEQWTLCRWLRTYPDLQLVVFDPVIGGRGVAVLCFAGETRNRFDPWTLVTSAHHFWRGRLERRRLRRRYG